MTLISAAPAAGASMTASPIAAAVVAYFFMGIPRVDDRKFKALGCRAIYPNGRNETSSLGCFAT
jgi:hypothetical protein